jgi:hypothetical protein
MDKVITPALKSVGVMLHRVKKSEYATVDLYGGEDGATLLVPAFTNQSGEIGKLSNFCSGEWKKRVVQRWINAQGVKQAETWLGISTDEMGRIQKDTGKKWKTRYPLIEQAMNRGDCVALVNRMGWPEPPRSSCWNCPNHTQHEWKDIRDNKPLDWSMAVQFDRDIRVKDKNAFLHHDCIPLEFADLSEKNGVLFQHCDSGLCYT